MVTSGKNLVLFSMVSMGDNPPKDWQLTTEGTYGKAGFSMTASSSNGFDPDLGFSKVSISFEQDPSRESNIRVDFTRVTALGETSISMDIKGDFIDSTVLVSRRTRKGKIESHEVPLDEITLGKIRDRVCMALARYRDTLNMTGPTIHNSLI